MENMYSGKSDTNPNKPLYIGLIIGLALIAFGIFMYFDLVAWEKSNEDKYMHSLLWGLYDLGGKLAVGGFFTVIGIISIIGGAVKTKQLRKIKEKTRF